MDLIVVTSEFPPGPGGIGRHAHDLASELVRRGWGVTVVGPQDYVTVDDSSAFNAAQPMRVVRTDGRRWLSRAFRRARLTRATLMAQPDAAVLATGETSVYLAALLLRRRRRWVAVGHGAEFGTRASWRRRLNRWAYSRAATVVCVSDYTRSRLVELDANPDHVEVITNGADASRLVSDGGAADRLREAWGVGSAPMILTVGHVSERKGQDVVIRALPQVLASIPDAHYVVVGLPSAADRFGAIADDLGVRDRVHFVGVIDESDLGAAYGASDVFAMTSRHDEGGDFEGYGIAAVEAALCGTPAVVTAGSGLQEAVVDGETGLVVPENDHAAVADALVMLLRHGDLRARMGEAAAQRARSTQTWDTQAPRYEAVLRSWPRSRWTPGGGRLVIISHTPHHRDASGRLHGWGATVREIDHLAELFESVVHVAPVYVGGVPAATATYESPRVRVATISPAGGAGVVAKLGIVTRIPQWTRAIWREAASADVVHVRCPSNVSLVALIALRIRHRPARAWVKYAGNWRPTARESASYEVQRRWLRHGWNHGVVTVNGRGEGDPGHIHSWRNPCLTEAEVQVASPSAASKQLVAPIRLLFVGRVEAPKGVFEAIEAARGLLEKGFESRLDVVGDGPALSAAREIASHGELHSRVSFHGWLDRDDLDRLYRVAHFVVLPTSSSEGFPKVLTEGMAWGAVPVTTEVSSIAATLASLGCGVAVANPSDALDAIVGYCEDPVRWETERDAGVRAAALFTYERYQQDVAGLLQSIAPRGTR